jgi:hypothetical protein
LGYPGASTLQIPDGPVQEQLIPGYLPDINLISGCRFEMVILWIDHQKHML